MPMPKSTSSPSPLQPTALHPGRLLAAGLTILVSLSWPQWSSAAETRDDKVRKDLAEHGESGLWIYNDLSKGLEQARQSGRPLLVVLRCVP